ncbi:hypothetical protein Y032_0034g2869 [Ancylostoma ceylanicum]|nr:hypothetical protein Y032_0034g2869 [Ancylostoma ceylanicum]
MSNDNGLTLESSMDNPLLILPSRSESDIRVPYTDESEEEERPAPIGSVSRFTQDPMEVQPLSEHSQIPTPENVSEKSQETDSPASEKETAEEVNPLNPRRRSTFDSAMPSEHKSTLPAEDGNPRMFRKSVSIASPKKTKERTTHVNTLMIGLCLIAAEFFQKQRIAEPWLRGTYMQDGSPSQYDSDAGYSERTPLLAPCSSLPSVVGYDSARSVFDFPGPSTARSEVGRDELSRRNKRRKARRYNSQRILETQKMRPYIASPFMPIATQLSIPLERRAPSSPKEAKRNLAYGSTRRPAEESLLAGDDQQTPSSNEE